MNRLLTPWLGVMLISSLLVLTGCTGLNLGAANATSWYTLADMRAGETLPPADRPIDRSLLIGPIDANPFFDSTQLAYSRNSSAHAYYQYAAWTDRPTRRLAQTIERRLAQRRAFTAVASSTAGIRGDLSLNLTLDELFHLAQGQPQQGRISLRAELVDLRSRTLLARQSFAASQPVIEADSAGAVRALNAALTQIIDEIVQWTEQSALAHAPKSD